MAHLRALAELSATATNTILGLVIGVLLAVFILIIFFLVAHKCRWRRSKPVLHGSTTARSTVDAYPVYNKAPRAYSYRYSTHSNTSNPAMLDSQRVFVQTQAGGFNATRAALGCTQAFGLGADATMDPSDRGVDMHRASSLTFQDLAASTRIMLGFADGSDQDSNRSHAHSSKALSASSASSTSSSTAMLKSTYTDHEPMRRLTEEPDERKMSMQTSRIVLATPLEGTVLEALPVEIDAKLVSSTHGLPSNGPRQHALTSSSHSVPMLGDSQLSNTDSLHVDAEDDHYLSARTPPPPAASTKDVAVPALSLYL